MMDKADSFSIDGITATLYERESFDGSEREKIIMPVESLYYNKYKNYPERIEPEIMFAFDRYQNQGTIIFRIKREEKQNNELCSMFNAQCVTSYLWGLNVVVVKDKAPERCVVFSDVSFQEPPEMSKKNKVVEWAFDYNHVVFSKYEDGVYKYDV